jgi:5-carboxyvanillate decarboxylase
MTPDLPRTLQEPTTQVGKADYLRIATEEAWCPPEMFDIYKRILDEGSIDDPGFMTMFGFYLNSGSTRARQIRDYITDLGAQRIAHMDERGIDKQVLFLTSPGVQVMPTAEAVAFAADANDQLAAGCARYPNRLAGLIAVAPQDPAAAAKEIDRGINKLGLHGVVINSHTFGEYLDDQKFWPILEAAEACDTPIYLHPQVPHKAMIEPFLDRGLDGAIYGFGVETGLHMLRIMVSGALDRFPRLQFVVGHLGEALPFWMYRLDYMHRAGVVSKRYAGMPPTERKLSDYLRQNIYVTTSGMAWGPAIKFCQEVLGEDRVMYAMDYPYQHGAEEVVATDNLDISQAAKKKLFQTNAERVFKLT